MLRPTLNTPSPTVQRSLRQYTVNGYTFHMVQVQKGCFLMRDDDFEDDEKSSGHWVDLAQDFELGQYLVTQALWEAVMGEPWRYLAFKSRDRSVERVNWDDIRKKKGGFLECLNALPAIKILNDKDGRRFALPSEAQWAYAALGGGYGSALPYEYAGSNYLPEVGWYKDNSQQESQSVGRKLPNVLGLYDMSGNVWEWCEDVEGHYKDTPKNGSPRITSVDESIRVVRGGSWLYGDFSGRVAFRFRYASDSRDYSVGFRLARYRTTP